MIHFCIFIFVLGFLDKKEDTHNYNKDFTAFAASRYDVKCIGFIIYSMEKMLTWQNFQLNVFY